MSAFYRVLLFTLLFGCIDRSPALEFAVQVLNEADGLPIQGARVTLDATPGGEIDHETTSTAFGFATFDDVPAGSYQLEVTRNGFAPSSGPVSLSAETESAEVELVANGPPSFDVYVSVSGVMTGLQLPGATITATRTDPGGGGGSHTKTADSKGEATFTSLPRGFYSFQITPPNGGWSDFTSPSVLLDKDHHADFNLVPVKFDAEIFVNGFDPAEGSEGAEGPLEKVWVEIVGIDPAQPDSETVPVRVATTASNGRAFIRGLPSGVRYEMKIKKYGYTPHEVTIPERYGTAGFSETYELEIIDHSLEVELSHPLYEKLEVYEGVKVELLGLQDTNTEGIERELDSGEEQEIRLFEDLLPGRYQIRIEDEGNNADLQVHPHFEYVDYVDIIKEGETIHLAELNVRPARILGQLFSASKRHIENKGNNRLKFDALVEGRPFYEPLANTVIELVEATSDASLISDARSFFATTDAEGRFSVELPPARWGLRLAHLTDHWGSHVLLKEVGADPDPLPPFPIPNFKQTFPAAGQGWPYADDWDFPGDPPSNGTPRPGHPLVLKGGDYELDVFLRKQTVAVSGPVTGDNPPTQSRLIGFERLDDDSLTQIRVTDYGDLNHGFVATLKPTGGGESLTSELHPAFQPRRLDGGGFESDGFFYFEAVPPGEYKLSFEHDRYTFERTSFPPGTPVSPADLTFEVKSWPAPGVMPTEDPADFSIPEPLTMIPPGGLSFIEFHTFSAEYQQGGPITIRRHEWIEKIFPEDPPSHYELARTDVYTANNANFEYVRPAYSGNSVFSGGSKIPNGPFTFWDGFRGSANGGPQTFDHYAGGPMDNSYETGDGTGAPAELSLPVYSSPGGGGGETYPLKVVVMNSAEPDGDPIDGINVRLHNGPTLASGATHNLPGIYDPELVPPVAVTTAPWLGDPSGDLTPDFQPILSHEFANIGIDGGVDLVPTLTVFVKRGIEIKGTVTAASPASGGVKGARALVRDRFGNIIAEAVTDVDGKWALPGGIEAFEEDSPPIFVDIRAPGYTPWRMRYTADSVEAGTKILDIATTIAALPGPTIEEPDFDREGKFLTGMYVSSEEDATTDALILKWEVEIEAPPQIITLLPFDTPDGTPGTPEQVTFRNPPAAVYVINPFGHNANQYNSRPGEEFVYKPGTDTDPRLLRKWFDDAVKRETPGIFFTQPVVPEKTGGNLYKAKGEIKIWKLPPGDFRPIIVVVGANGGVSIRSDYADPTTDTRDTIEPLMEGLRLPSWMGTAANVMGVTGAAQNAAGELTDEARGLVGEALEGVFPKGKFKALPGFTGGITAIGSGAGRSVLKYNYGIEMEWLEGMKSPGNKWLRFLPDPLGLEMKIGTSLGLDNTMPDTPFFLDGNFSAAVEPQKFIGPSIDPYVTKDPFRMTPSWTAEVTPMLEAGFTASGSEITREGSFELKVESHITAELVTALEVNLLPLTSKIPPPTGQILQGLDASEVLQLFATIDTGLGFNLTSEWETKPPEAGSVIGGVHVPLLGFPYGGYIRNPPSEVALGCALAGGIKAKMFSERVGLKVALGVSGPEDPFSFSALTATARPDNGWPYVERVQGQVGLQITGEVDAWIVKWEKRWDVPFITIDRSFTTEPAFFWQPLETSFTATGPGDSPSPVLNPNGNTLINDFYTAGSMSGAQGDGDELLVFTGINPANGRMTVEAGKRSAGGDFSPADVIAEAGGIIDVETARLADGTWLVVWSEIATGDVGRAFPGSTLRFATSTDGTIWTAPTNISAPLPNVAASLRLDALGDLAVLAVTTTGGGPRSTQFDLHLAAFDTDGWTPLSRQGTKRQLVDFDLAIFGPAATPEVIVAASDGESATESFIWNKVSGDVTNLPPIPGAAGSLSLSGGNTQRVALARAMIGSNVEILLLDEPESEWEPATETLPGEMAGKLRLVPLPAESAHSYLLGWFNGGRVSLMNFAYIDATGEAASLPTIAEGSPDGDFRDLVVYTRDGETVLIGSDPDGGSAQQAIVSNNVETVQARLLNPRFSAINGFSADVVGLPGRTYRILRSSDLKNWLEAGEVEAGGIFNDPGAVEDEKQFYLPENTE